MLKRLLRSTITGILGLCLAYWAGSILFGTCTVDRFGCAPDVRIWVWLIFGCGVFLVLTSTFVWGAFLFEFRKYYKQADENAIQRRQLRMHRLRKAAEPLKRQIQLAKDTLSHPLAEAPENPSPEEFKRAMDAHYRRKEAEYLSKIDQEPVRVVGWLLANLINHQAISIYGDLSAPLLGTVTINHDQKPYVIVGNSNIVTLMVWGKDEAVGDPIDSEDMVAILREFDLPVWDELLPKKK